MKTKWFLLRLAFGLALLALLIFACDPREVVASFTSARLNFLLLAFLFYLLAYVVTAWRWYLLLDSDCGITFWDTVRYTLTAVFCNNFLPTGFGGDVTRIANMSRHRVPISRSLGLIFLERLTGFLVIGLLIFLSLPCLWEFLSTLWETKRGELLTLFLLILVVLSVMLGVMIIAFSVRCATIFEKLLLRLPWKTPAEFIKTFLEAVRGYGASFGKLFQLVLVSILLQVCFTIAFQLALLSLDIHVPLGALFALLQITSLLGILPLTIETTGVREFIFLLFLSPLGYDKAGVLSALLLARFLGIVSALPGIVFVITDGLPGREKK